MKRVLLKGKRWNNQYSMNQQPHVTSTNNHTNAQLQQEQEQTISNSTATNDNEHRNNNQQQYTRHGMRQQHNDKTRRNKHNIT